MALSYRPEIDGIRAIAVIAVVLFHLNIPGFNGGFIGVDIFFVISGYLITSILLREVDTGAISLSSFYERRARRILPLVVVIIIFSLLVTWPLYTTQAFKAIGSSVAGASAFVANIVLMRRKGYFMPSVHEDPLLHLWSLSVEEQFYIFLPICLLLIHKYCRRSFVYWLLGLTILSFAFNIFLCNISAKVAFYLAPTRAWEFFAGGLLSLPVGGQKSSSRWMAWVGIIAIGLSVCFFDDSIPYPGRYALLPVAGTVLLILGTSADSSAMKFVLSLRPVVFIGRISYSIYMWHWPLLVFANMLVLHTLSPTQNILFLILLVIISTSSYYFIEQPFRNKKLLKSRRSLALACAISLVILGCIGAFIKQQQGMPGRFIENKMVADAERDPFMSTEKIKDSDDRSRRYYQIGDSKKTASFILWGDSYARVFSYGIDSLARNIHTSGYCITFSTTPPLSGINIKGQELSLSNSTSQALAFINTHKEIGSIILAGRWSIYYSDKYIQTYPKPQIKEQLSKKRLFAYSLHQTIDTLLAMGRTVYLVAPIPELDASLNKIIFRKRAMGSDINSNGTEMSEYLVKNEELLQLFSGIQEQGKIKLISVNSFLPQDKKYAVELNNMLLYRDAHHLSIKGSQLVAPSFVEAIR